MSIIILILEKSCWACKRWRGSNKCREEKWV